MSASRLGTSLLVSVAAAAALTACGGSSDHRATSTAATRSPPANNAANPPMRIPPQGTPEFKRWHERRLRILKKAFREAHRSAGVTGPSSP
jgi:hypothetical protein